jgi:hypothetical protein
MGVMPFIVNIQHQWYSSALGEERVPQIGEIHDRSDAVYRVFPTSVVLIRAGGERVPQIGEIHDRSDAVYRVFPTSVVLIHRHQRFR